MLCASGCGREWKNNKNVVIPLKSLFNTHCKSRFLAVSIKQLSNKIELSFWHIAINMLTCSPTFRLTFKWGYMQLQHVDGLDRVKQKISWLLAGTAAGLLIVVIVITSFLISSTYNRSSKLKIVPFPTPSNGQQNILAIGVDDLESETPRLVGIWLLIYFPTEPYITFAPIYPHPLRNIPQQSGPLASSFRLDQSGNPHEDFFELLQQEQIWWHGYILIDSTAVAEAINFFEASSVEGDIFTVDPTGTSPLYSESYPPTIATQSYLIDQLCQQASRATIDTDISQILNLIPRHVHTDLTMINIIQDWHSLISQEDNFVCEFPLQRASTP